MNSQYNWDCSKHLGSQVSILMPINHAYVAEESVLVFLRASGTPSFSQACSLVMRASKDRFAPRTRVSDGKEFKAASAYRTGHSSPISWGILHPQKHPSDPHQHPNLKAWRILKGKD